MNSENLKQSDSDFPLVSIAVVTYNQEEFINECIDSILSQDYPNIEIIVADDGSTDGTSDLLLAYQKQAKRPFILKLSPINQGVTKNQNLALFSCTGKYISWMAGDDLMLPGKISKQVEFLEKNPDYAICYHNLDIFDSKTNRTLNYSSQVNKPREGGRELLVKYGAFNGAVSNMVKRSSSPEHGFDVRIPVASDWLYWVECLWNGDKIGYIDEVLARHRRHENNVTHLSIKDPSLSGVQDQLFSCDIILSRAPYFFREINGIKAYSFKSLRWIESGKYYEKYLRASLSYQFNIKVFIAYLCCIFFKIKLK